MVVWRVNCSYLHHNVKGVLVEKEHKKHREKSMLRPVMKQQVKGRRGCVNLCSHSPSRIGCGGRSGGFIPHRWGKEVIKAAVTTFGNLDDPLKKPERRDRGRTQTNPAGSEPNTSQWQAGEKQTQVCVFDDFLSRFITFSPIWSFNLWLRINS